jgi:hypothetical protein
MYFREKQGVKLWAFDGHLTAPANISFGSGSIPGSE